MRAYGIPRDPELEFPDCQTVAEYGLAARRGNVPGPGGDTHSNHRSASAKARTRRRFKRRARADGKRAISDGLND